MPGESGAGSSQQAVATLFLPLVLHPHMGVCVPLVHVFPACPVYAVPMCVSEDGSPGLQGRF